jgi:hypothetical protein
MDYGNLHTELKQRRLGIYKPADWLEQEPLPPTLPPIEDDMASDIASRAGAVLASMVALASLMLVGLLSTLLLMLFA